jgi:hypothetical protein
MRTAVRSISERTVKEVLFIDRLDQHHNGTLRHLVFEGRNTEAALTASRLVYVFSTTRGRSITARFESIDQIGQVLLQIDCIGLRRLSVHSDRAVFARTLVGVLHPFHIKIVIQRRERHRCVLSRELGYPLLFR